MVLRTSPGETPVKGSTLTCTDGDPGCDTDGACDGSCTFDARLCVDQALPGCVPPAGVQVHVKSGGVPAPGGADCGAPANVRVPLRHAGKKPGKLKIAVVGTAPRGTKPRADVDRYILVCKPRAGSCPIVLPTTTTTTTTSPSASTTSTTTTIASSIGSACTVQASCGIGQFCIANVPGGGYCTADCTASGLCPARATCVDVSVSTSLCLESCQAPGDCRAEHVCLANLCLPKCTRDADCSSSNCDTGTGRCGPSRVGNACAQDGDCGQPPALCDTSWPQGYCSLPCGGSTNVTCPAGSNCSSVGGSSACLEACSVPGDCRTGFVCAPDSGGFSSCIPRCSQNGDCAPGLRCDTGSGACVEAGPAPGQLGGSCAIDAECTAAVGAGAFCGQAAGYPDGYCSISCLATACPPGGTCVAFSPTDHDCLSACTGNAGCRSGYYCFDLGGGAGGVCTPKCTTDADCGDPSLACEQSSGLCVPKPTGGSGTTTETIDLTPGGPIPVGTNVLTARLVVTIPSDAVSVDFIGQAISDPTARVVVYRIEQTTDDFATSTRLYDYASISNLIRVLPPAGPGAFSVLYPNSPGAPFATSSASTTVKVGIRLLASRPTTASVSAIIKHAPSPVLAQGQVDLNLFFVGVPGLDATSARTDARFQQVFDRLKTIWAQTGITVGTVSYLDITGADAARYSDLHDADLGSLMMLSQNPGARDNALNVFFVHTITGGSLNGYIILGESAGIPGVPVRGTSGSGMAVTMADFPGGLDEIADTWAHEGGHWLGLFHPTESAGTSFDPLPDTPECPRAPYDTNADGIMEPVECQMHGAENEMFWTSTASIPHASLSANQSFVMLRNPAVH